MKRYLTIALILWPIAFFDLIALAAGPMAMAPETRASWFEHADLMTILIGVLITLISFFIVRTLAKIDRNQNRLFEKLDAVCKQVDTLQGEHNVMKDFCAGGTSRKRPGE